jgi:hypothetical protein
VLSAASSGPISIPGLASDALVGPIMLRLLLTGGRITPGLAVTLVGTFYEGWGVAPCDAG